ncbi:MAG: alkaline phosphatase family protein, partial [Deltaproteobacteria bacterium]|nr:alkaline phosphatase family protein [Deltaproteobacteria bacterium]
MNQNDGVFERCIFILFDGARSDLFAELLEAGELPAIRRHLVEPGCSRSAVAAFPTVSGPGHLPFMTGCFPGTLNVSGVYWFDREAYGRSLTGLTGFRTYLGPFKVRKMNQDVTPSTPNLAQVWPDVEYVFGWYTRGSADRALLTRWTKSVSFVRGFMTKDWLQCDADAEVKLMQSVDGGASFIFAVFPAPDELGHRFGPTGDETRTAYARLDQTIDRLFKRLGDRSEADSTLVMIGSDHGQSNTHTHFPLDRFVEERVGRTLIYKRFATPLHGNKAAVLPNGNGMANVHFRGEGWTSGRPDLTAEPYQGLIGDLLEQEPMDILAWREEDGWIRMVSRRGAARFRETGPSMTEYDPSASDPFGYEGLEGAVSFDQWLQATADHDYPDGPVSLATHLRAPRSGDLIVTTFPG